MPDNTPITPDTPGKDMVFTKPNIPDCWTPEPGGGGTRTYVVAEPQEVTITEQEYEGVITTVEGYQVPFSGIPTNYTVTVDGNALTINGAGGYEYIDETTSTTYSVVVGVGQGGMSILLLTVTDSGSNPVPGTYTVSITATESQEVLICNIALLSDGTTIQLDKTWLEILNAGLAVLVVPSGVGVQRAQFVTGGASGNGDGTYTYTAVFMTTQSDGEGSYVPQYIPFMTDSPDGYPSVQN